MNLLAIGNSFSEDATRYLHDVARADGEIIHTVNLYIGGCSLERHYKNMLSDEPAYEWQYNGHKTDSFVSLREALLNRAWDVVTLQQVSTLSFDRGSYEPYLSALMDFVRRCSPSAKIYIHQTWAYEQGSTWLSEVAQYPTPEGMLADVVQVYDEVSESVGADGIIRSGEMFGMLSGRGMGGLYRDGLHASLGLGRYALGLLWYRVLTGKSVGNNPFCDFDEAVSEEDIRAVREIVNSYGSIMIEPYISFQ